MDKKAKVEIVRLAVERITATVLGDSERVEVEIHWHGVTAAAARFIGGSVTCGN